MMRKVSALVLTAALTAAAFASVTAITSGTVASATDVATALPACSDAFHNSFTAAAQDGEQYPTWHPTTAVDPATDTECAFGHEHGDDPNTSDIAAWTLDKLGDTATGVTFGFAAHMSMMSGGAHRHEDHFGHKVFVINNVNLVREDREGYVLTSAGTPVQCDYLIYSHQGSHSGDALKNNQHELLYSTQCTDGTEMVINVLNGFGNANEYQTNCDLRTVTTGGSDLPNGTAGGREIPDVQCLQQTQGQFWGAYELWKADNSIIDTAGNVLAQYDPWFGVRNPSRIANGADPIDTISLATEGWATWPWNTAIADITKNDPASPFDGAQRDVYVQHSTLNNTTGAATVYTNAYGQAVSSTPFEGAIAQYLGTTPNVGQAEAGRTAFGFSTDYGSGNGVHASN